MNHFDAIIVGGRPAGATLAARLGMAGLHVLLLERATFPALPGASCPLIYSPVMGLLDEIGADEAAYARNTPKIRRLVNDGDGLKGQVRIPMIDGRDYGYAIDRARFDAALFEHARSFPTVTACDGFSVIDLMWDGDDVVGVVGHGADKVRQQFTADLVVGADGRFSTIARKVNAAERDEHDEYPTSIIYAYWRGVAPYDEQGDPVALAHGPGRGYGFLMMESADDTVCIAIEGKSELLEAPPGGMEEFYEGMVRAHEPIDRRLANAERATPVKGMKRIGNLYRQAGGPGWALVGDAYHQKDPIDGQGIYDAVFTAKALADAITAWKRGALTWAQAVVQYDEAARAETFKQYHATLSRVRASIYTNTPTWIRPIARYIMEDTLCQEQLGMMLVRQADPANPISAPVLIGALLRGPLRDLSRALERQIERV